MKMKVNNQNYQYCVLQLMAARASTVWTNQGAEFKTSVIWLDGTFATTVAKIFEKCGNRWDSCWDSLTHWFRFISWERHVVVLSLLWYITSCEQPHKTCHLLHKGQTFIGIENINLNTVQYKKWSCWEADRMPSNQMYWHLLEWYIVEWLNRNLAMC